MSEMEDVALPVRKTLILEREEWLSELKVEEKEEMLFELEMLLKAIDRFFNIDNIPISDPDGVFTRNFIHELVIARNAVARIAALTRNLLAKDDFKLFHFENYIESKVLKDHTRDVFIQRFLDQKSPKESLCILGLNFVNLLEILDALIRLKTINSQLFTHLGQLISRQIVTNKYFNPFRLRAFMPRFERIKNPKIIASKNRIKDPELRKNITVLLLAFYRILHYLSYTDEGAKETQKLRDNLVIFSLIHSESNSLITYIEADLLKSKKLQAEEPALFSTLDSLSFQFKMELKKIYKVMLRDFSESNLPIRLKACVDSAKGVLKNFSQQAIVQISKAINETISGEEIFPDFVSRLAQSVKLREDIWMLGRVVAQFEGALQGQRDEAWVLKASKTLLSLKEFVSYFESFSLNNVRLADLEGFVQFIEQFGVLSEEDIVNKAKHAEMANNTHYFKIFIETTLGQLNNRSELAGIPLDEKRAMENLSKFLIG